MPAWELANITARLLLPPGALLLLGLLGLALIRSRARLGMGLALFAFLSLYVLSTPLVARLLVQSLESPYTDPALGPSAGAIVVLTGGSQPRAPEYGTDTTSRFSLERARYAAHLHRRTGTPILVTGGNPIGAATSEAEQVKVVLSEFGVATKWIENASNNTYENALFSSRILQNAGVHSVHLVTHAWHMPRARMAFERAGLNVIAAPMGFKTDLGVRPLDFFPSAPALNDSFYFFHEILGIAWYRLRFALAR